MADRILSIQSHVTFGYVGGKAAVFPLQCLGYDVDVVNTVNFSNHSGYGKFGGTRATAADLQTIFGTMEENEILSPRRLLTGYIPGAEALSAVAGMAKKLRQQDPEMIYLLDPVLGDSGKLYVAADVIPVYRDLLPYTTIITPNWFEVETLTSIKLDTIAHVHQALTKLHEEYKVTNVVVSSIPLYPWLLEALPPSLRPPSDGTEDQEYLLCIASSYSPTERRTVHAGCVPLIPGYFSGVGDLFSALLLGHFDPSLPPSESLPAATSEALTKTHAILQLTDENATAHVPAEERQRTDDELDLKEPLRKTRRMRGRELRLIQGQDIIRGKGLEGKERKMGIWGGFWS